MEQKINTLKPTGNIFTDLELAKKFNDAKRKIVDEIVEVLERHNDLDGILVLSEALRDNDIIVIQSSDQHRTVHFVTTINAGLPHYTNKIGYYKLKEITEFHTKDGMVYKKTTENGKEVWVEYTTEEHQVGQTA